MSFLTAGSDPQPGPVPTFWGGVINESILCTDVVLSNQLRATFQHVIGVAGGQFCPIYSHYLERREGKRVWLWFWFSVGTHTDTRQWNRINQICKTQKEAASCPSLPHHCLQSAAGREIGSV